MFEIEITVILKIRIIEIISKVNLMESKIMFFSGAKLVKKGSESKLYPCLSIWLSLLLLVQIVIYVNFSIKIHSIGSKFSFVKVMRDTNLR